MNVKPALFFLAILAAVGGLFWWGRGSKPASESPKDPRLHFGEGKALPDEIVRDRLRLVNDCIQKYRKEKTVLPPAQRRNFRDAGLPPGLASLAKAGQKWSLPHGIDDLRFNMPIWNRRYENPFVNHIQPLYRYDGNVDDARTWRELGEKRPIVICDLVVDEAEYFSHQHDGYRVMILRLNGQIEVVKFEPDHEERIFR